jgi:hypothetical protein
LNLYFETLKSIFHSPSKTLLKDRMTNMEMKSEPILQNLLCRS